MKRKITSLKPNECIHITTEKEAKKIAKLADKNDIFNPALKKKGSETVIHAYNQYRGCCITLETATGYNNELYFCYSSEGFALKEVYELIPASDFIKPKSKLKNRVKALEVKTDRIIEALSVEANPEAEMYKKLAGLLLSKQELSELPEKWCVKDCEGVSEWAYKKYYCVNKVSDRYFHANYDKNGDGYGFFKNIKKGYTEISFADFKRLALGGEKTGWFKHSNDAGDYLFTYKDPENTNYVYGFFRGAWTYESWTWGSGVFCEPATEEEVKAALIAEAEKRGHNTTCAVYEMWNNQLYVNIEGFGKAILFENGRWSEVKKEEQEIDWSKPGQYVSTDDEGLILMTLEGDSIGDNTFSAVVIQDNRNNYCHYDAGNKSDIWLKSNFKLHTEPITINPV